jgi:hypothetical protein
MPTFCRHNRFIERCPICSKSLPGNESTAGPGSRAPRPAGRARAGSGGAVRRGGRGAALKVRHEGRAPEDGYRSELVPGLHSSADAARLAAEIEFSNARLAALALEPPGLYREARELASEGELERATWTCLLVAYLGPTEGADPFAAIRTLLALAPGPADLPEDLGERLEAAELGSRSSHRAGQGRATIDAYRQWLARNGGAEQTQATAFGGDATWTPERRFSRLFERLALPGFGRAGRYELLLTLGRLGMYELRADSLLLSGPRSQGAEDATTVAAKRVFGIGDPMLLDRRAADLARAGEVPIEALDLALANWQGPVRATMGFRAPESGEGSPASSEPSPAVAAALGL